MNEFTERTSEIKDSAKKSEEPKFYSDVGFETKGKICQINETAQVTDASDTENEDSTKIKNEDIKALIFSKIPIAHSSPSRSIKTRDTDKWDNKEWRHQTSVYFDIQDYDSSLDINSLSLDSDDEWLESPPYRCRSSDNNEEQISRMDKIIAQGNIPDVPRRNRPAPPPPDVLD